MTRHRSREGQNLAANSIPILQVLLLLLLLLLLRALVQASVTRCCKQALLLAGTWCCCSFKRAYHRRRGSDLRSYDALFITVEPGFVVAVQLRLRCWPGGNGDMKSPGCQVGLAGENLEQELCLIFYVSFDAVLLGRGRRDNERMRVLIPAGAEQRTR